MKLHRKLIAPLLTAVLLLGTLALPASAAELPFTDVPDNEWYTSAVKYAYENNLFQGEGNGKFNPNGSMTRAMFVQVLANKTNNYNKADWAGKSSFSDVNKDKWYAAPVEWASKAGLVSGKGNGKFDPNGKVTRQEMAVIMYRYAKATGNDTSFNSSALSGFSDASSVSGWAKEAMQWAVTHKVIAGSGGKLNPTGNAKRCEVAQVTKNADPVLVKNEVKISNTPDPTPNPDPTPDPGPDDQMGLPEKYISGVDPTVIFKNGVGFTERKGDDGKWPQYEEIILTRYIHDGFVRDPSIYIHPVYAGNPETRFSVTAFVNDTTGDKVFLARDYPADPNLTVRHYCIKLGSAPTASEVNALFQD